MNKLKVVSLFSGVGAFEKGLKNSGIDFELIKYCEIVEHASKCYSLIHNIDEALNLWDVTKIDTEQLEDFDLLTHGSPCQTISVNGKQEGADEGSGFRSSLVWETVKVIKAKLPRFVVWENVKNLISENHIHNLNKYIETLNELGYKSTYKVLNSKKFNIPQNRDRVFVVSILNGEEFMFPKEVELTNKLVDYCEFREKDDITDNFVRYYNENVSSDDFMKYFNNITINRTGVKNMKMYRYDQLNRVTVVNASDKVLSPTLSCRGVQNYCIKFYYNGRIYKPSPKMCFKLMGFSDEDFDKIKDIGRDKDLWDRAGNSIVVDVPQAIFKELFKEYINKI